jgi:hypothetical protein
LLSNSSGAPVQAVKPKGRAGKKTKKKKKTLNKEVALSSPELTPANPTRLSDTTTATTALGMDTHPDTVEVLSQTLLLSPSASPEANKHNV